MNDPVTTTRPAGGAMLPETLHALISSRRAVRRFTPEPVPDDVIRHCLELATLAPSSCNLQPWSFQVIRSPELLQKLHPVCLGQSAARAPLIIAVLARPDTWKASCAQIISDWPEPQVPTAIKRFYSGPAPFQYNQGRFGWRSLYKVPMLALMGLRKAVMRSPSTPGEMRIWAVKSTALAAQNLMLAFQSHGYATCPMEGFDERRLRRTLTLPKAAIPIMLLAVGKPGERAVYNPRLRFPLEQLTQWL